MRLAAVPSTRRGDGDATERQATAVRQFLAAGVAVTLVDDRPDDDGFGLPDADPVLLREAAAWLEAHPALELTGVHAGQDALGRRQLVVTTFGDPGDLDAPMAGPTRLVALPETD